MYIYIYIIYRFIEYIKMKHKHSTHKGINFLIKLKTASLNFTKN